MPTTRTSRPAAVAPRYASAPMLSLSSVGAPVRSLQDRLRALGFDPGATDGVYGPATRRAVVAFQRSRRIDVDGIVGPVTWAKLQAGPTPGPTARPWQPPSSRPAVPAAPAAAPTTPGPTTPGRRPPAPAAPASPAAPAVTPGGLSISDRGQAQMSRLVDYARSHNSGVTGGRCFEYVWRYMTSSGYGKLRSWGDLPSMNGSYARNFADYLNAGPARLREAGLQRLDTGVSPRITNPHDPRIPPGAVIVVAPGSTGTSDPIAGDIVVRGRSRGEFLNDGSMGRNMGTRSTWRGQILGVYVPT
jgi:hypothetical protein